jgi:hypothetical protein
MKVPIYRCKYFPLGNYIAINLFGCIVARKGVRLSAIDINHELIHSRQQVEMLWIFFYLWYVVEWIIKLFIYKNATEAYFNISFEREAYRNEHKISYLRERRPYSWAKHLKSVRPTLHPLMPGKKHF